MTATAAIEVVPGGEPAAALALPADLLVAARNYVASAKAKRTREAYACAWRGFEQWCAAHGRGALPASGETVALYLAHRAGNGCKPATIEVDLSAIAQAHKVAGHPSPRQEPAVLAMRQGIRRELGTAHRKKAPLLPAMLRAISGALPATRRGTRDRALLLLGFAAALRRSELVALELADLVFTDDGIELTIRRSKTDQEGAGEKIGVPFGSEAATCPVRSVRLWLDAARLERGPVFREVNRHGHVGEAPLTGHSVARIVKRAAREAGLDAANLSGHSMRAGLATAAIKAGKPAHVVMRQTRHKSVQVFQGYVRDADLFGENAAAGIGL